MQPKSTDLDTDLVLEQLPNCQTAWLRPDTASPVDRYQVKPNVTDAEDDEALYVVTDAGRRAIAAAALFGPWPTVAQIVVRGAA
jgi:hypothetical protein